MRKYSIYQVNEDAANGRYILFSSLDLLQDMGIKLSLDQYNRIYEGQIEEEATIEETLEAIFVQMNIGKKPEGYNGHSLSVSDIIEIGGKFYYCDSYGFTEVQLAQKKAVYTVLIFNERAMKRERKNFSTQEKADAYYEQRKSKVTLACPAREKFFCYRNEWGNMMHVQKMY
jgi:hypothetical protein